MSSILHIVTPQKLFFTSKNELVLNQYETCTGVQEKIYKKVCVYILSTICP